MTMTDRYANLSPDLQSPATSAVAVTPSDTAVIETTKGLYIGTAGTLKVTMADGTAVAFGNVGVGVLPIRCSVVWQNGTAAQNIVALY